MKKFKNLTSEDFPGTDPIKFQKWKQAGQRTIRLTNLSIVILVIIHLQIILRFPISNIPLAAFLLWGILIFIPYKYNLISNELNIKDERPIKTLTIVKKIIKWIFGITLLFGVVDSIKYGNIIFSVLWIASGLIILPPLNKMFENKWGIKKKRLFLYPIMIVLILVATFVDVKFKNSYLTKLNASRLSLFRAIQQQQETIEKESENISDIPKKVSEFDRHNNSNEDKNTFVYIENNLLKIKISTLGGKPYSVELKDFKAYNGQPLILFNGDSTIFGLEFFAQNKSVSTNQLFFKYIPSDTINKKTKSRQAIFRLYSGLNSYIEYLYSLNSDTYYLDFQVRFVNMDSIINKDSPYIDLNWVMYISQQEIDGEFENNKTTICYKYLGDDIEKLPSVGKEMYTENIPVKIEWITFKQEHFSSILIAESGFVNAQLEYKNIYSSSKYLKVFEANLGLGINSFNDENLKFMFYFGPNKIMYMNQYGQNFKKVLPFYQRLFWIR